MKELSKYFKKNLEKNTINNNANGSFPTHEREEDSFQHLLQLLLLHWLTSVIEKLW